VRRAPDLAEAQALVRALVEQEVEPVRRALREAQQRVAELERQLVAAAQALQAAQAARAPAPAAAAVPAAGAAPAPVLPRPPALSSPGALGPGVAITPARGEALSLPMITSVAPAVDLAALARDAAVDVDVRGFDGGRRRRRTVLLFALFLLAVFGGLFYLLAASYAHPAP
jgi:hypothetical protein